jgi:kumamolisin
VAGSPKDPNAVAGSGRLPIRGVLRSAPVPAGATIDITVRLRAASRDKAKQVYAKRPGAKRVDRATLATLVGASAADARVVESFAHSAGLTVIEVSLPRRSIVLRGTAAVMQKAFGVTLQSVETSSGTYRERTGEVHVPPALAAIVTGVFGLDDRPQAKPHFRRQAKAVAGSLSPPAVGKAYQFPPAPMGQGQSIGLIELGGGYRAADLATYFKQLGVTAPTVIPVGVDGATNAPTGSADGPDAEVVLDIEVSGSLAPQATIVVYFAPNTDRGFLDAVTTAVHDTTHAPTVLSISWGGAESTWTAQATQALDEAIAEAVAVGIPVCVACGDDGATDGQTDGALHVDFPASSPHAIACGGTRLTISGTTATDVTWNDLAANEGATGGGFSALFAAPAWQSAAIKPFNQTGRGVPDVSGDADPETGYTVLVDGTSTVLGGTSAVAPLWAALFARCQQASAQQPTDLAALLYGAESTGFRDVTQGGNGGYNAGPGWDPCTGLGVPIGSALLTAVWGNGAAPARKKAAKKKAAKKKAAAKTRKPVRRRAPTKNKNRRRR